MAGARRAVVRWLACHTLLPILLAPVLLIGVERAWLRGADAAGWRRSLHLLRHRVGEAASDVGREADRATARPSSRTSGQPRRSCRPWGYNPELNTSNWTRSSVRLVLPVAEGQVWHVKAGRVVKFRYTLKEDFCDQEAVQAKSRLGQRWTTASMAWFRSVDGNIVSEAPAVHKTAEDKALGIWTVQVDRIDAAVYDVWVFRIANVLQKGVWIGSMRPEHFAGSPFRLHVHPPAGSGLSTAGGLPSVQLPRERCSLGDADVYGRWVRCSSLCASECTRDGWIFVPWTCSYGIRSVGEVKAIAARRAQERGRPLWIVVVSRSTGRGLLHSVADLVCGGCSFFEEGHMSRPGKGTVVKCWNWFDYLHGSIRMSFQDWRPVHRNLTPYGLRLAQIIREGPDVVLLESFGLAAHKWLIGVYRQNARLIQSWRGTILFLETMVGTSGRVGRDYFSCDYARTQRDSLFQKDRPLFAKELEELEAEIPGVAGKTRMWDVNSMTWPFLFDMEKPLNSGRATAHWHRYVNYSGPRKVFGASAEMAAHVLLAFLVDHSSPSRAATPASDGYLGEERLLCVNCPVKSCCPWPPPPTFPKHTLSVPRGELRLDSKLSSYSCVSLP